MSLDLISLEKATASLQNAVAAAQEKHWMETLTDAQRETVKAGVVQNFEFTYELCWKFIQRWIQMNQTPEIASPQTRKDLFRLAARFGLIDDPAPWFKYAEARNITAHIYDEKKSKKVYQTALQFSSTAKKFLQQLRQLNDRS